MRTFISFFALIFFASLSWAQPYSILIKNGRVIDPKNNIDAVMDIAVSNSGKIAQVAKDIDPKQATQVIDAKGLIVTPGLVDIHTHNFVGPNADQAYMNGPGGVLPDGFTFI